MRRAAGSDREVRAKFLDLARDSATLGAWVRLHYVYPYPHVDEVIPLMAEGKVLPYLDIPFQHASPRVLKAMRRPAHQEKTARAHRTAGATSARTSPSARPSSSASPARPRRISKSCSTGSTRRSSIASAASSSSRSAGAPANDLADPVPDEVKEQRWHRFMARQQAISARRLAEEGRQPRSGHRRRKQPASAKGRSMWDAPEIDGTVHLTGRLPIRAGEIVTARVERADAYDLFASVA